MLFADNTVEFTLPLQIDLLYFSFTFIKINISGFTVCLVVWLKGKNLVILVTHLGNLLRSVFVPKLKKK